MNTNFIKYIAATLCMLCVFAMVNAQEPSTTDGGSSGSEPAVTAPSFTKPTPQASSSEYHKNEFYVGYSHHKWNQTEFSSGMRFNGVESSYTRNLNRYFGLKGVFALRFHRQAITTFSPLGKAEFTETVFLGGVQVKDNSKKTRFKPFGHALFGVNHWPVRTSCYNPFPGCEDLGSISQFEMKYGGGLDIKVNKRIDIRVVQADYVRQNFRSNAFSFWYNSYNIGAGIVFH